MRPTCPCGASWPRRPADRCSSRRRHGPRRARPGARRPRRHGARHRAGAAGRARRAGGRRCPSGPSSPTRATSILGRRFALIIVPMQTIQLLPERAGFLAAARAHLAPGGLLAMAITQRAGDVRGAQRTSSPRPTSARPAAGASRPSRRPCASCRTRTRVERRRLALGPGGRRHRRGRRDRARARDGRRARGRGRRGGPAPGAAPQHPADRAARRLRGGAAAWLTATLRVCALYPDLMNIYADRGNLTVFERRCAWRGLGFELAGAGIGDAVDPDAHDLFYIGGGQDRDQALCARDLATVKRDALHAAAARGAVVFAVCGGLQLLGHGYEMEDEQAARRRAGRPRHAARGRAAAARQHRHRRRPAGRPAGAGRLREPRRPHVPRSRRAAARPGPEGQRQQRHRSDGEGVRGGPHGTVIGTYMHGPLLPKNTGLADWLTAAALGMRAGRPPGAGRRTRGRGARRGPARGRSVTQ